MMASLFECRIEVYRDSNVFKLKSSDVTVSRIARIFKLKPSSIYLEEDDTKNAEFPEDGRFVLLSAATRYKVCGDEDTPGIESDRMETPPSRSVVMGPGGPGHWSIPRPWQQQRESDIQMGPGPSFKRQKTIPYESCLKRSFPYVSLCLDESGKNVCVDTITSNVYIKIPDSNVSLQGILNEVAAKIGEPVAELILLDSKFIEIGDDSRDLEYWKMPSRRFYVAKRDEYEDILRLKNRKRLGLGLSLGKKKVRAEVIDLTTDDQHILCRIEESTKKMEEGINEIKVQLARNRDICSFMECKICKDIPTPPICLVMCCKQIVGCQECLNSCIETSGSCPLCRAAMPESVHIHGLDGVLQCLRRP